MSSLSEALFPLSVAVKTYEQQLKALDATIEELTSELDSLEELGVPLGAIKRDTAEWWTGAKEFQQQTLREFRYAEMFTRDIDQRRDDLLLVGLGGLTYLVKREPFIEAMQQQQVFEVNADGSLALKGDAVARKDALALIDQIDKLIGAHTHPPHALSFPSDYREPLGQFYDTMTLVLGTSGRIEVRFKQRESAVERERQANGLER